MIKVNLARVLHMYVHKSICECFIHKYKKWMLYCAVLITLLCLTLCNSMDYSTPGFPVLQYLLEFAQTYVHWVSDAIQPSHLLWSTSSPALNLSQPQSLFLCWLFASGGQSIGASASASDLPMNIQGWFSLGLTGLILLSKGLSRVFSSTTVWKHQFFLTAPPLISNFESALWSSKKIMEAGLLPSRKGDKKGICSWEPHRACSACEHNALPQSDMVG